MAIKMRRGNYSDLDTSKLVGGEIAVTDNPSRVVVKTNAGSVIKLVTEGSVASDAFANIKVGSSTIEAIGDDTLEMEAGNGVTLTPDTTNKKVTISAAISVEDSLTSSSTTDALSANQGKVLKDLVDSKADTSSLSIKADLVSGKVPASQLPSYVDDVIEGYYYNGAFYEEAAHTTEITPEAGKIYVDLSTNVQYRWGGSAYVEISSSLALGETAGTAYEGSKGKANADAITEINSKISSAATSSNKLIAETELRTGTASADVLLRRTQGHTNKNILHVLDEVVDTTINGITYTITRNDEGEVTQIDIDGTATEDSILELNPSVDIYGTSSKTVLTYCFDNASQHNNEYKFFFDNVSGQIYRAYIKVFAGYTADHVIGKPMVRDVYTSAKFEPYHAYTTDDEIAAIKGVIPSGASTSNKLATASDIPAVDQTYNAASVNAQSGAAVAGAISPITEVIPSGASSSNKLVTASQIYSQPTFTVTGEALVYTPGSLPS